MIKIYKVGGCVRDATLGVRSKDIDCAVEAPSFAAMEAWIIAQGGEIFLSKPEFFTVRAKIGREAMDFVLCRKESGYSDGRHPDAVEMGTILDDLARRDFTMNAIAIPMEMRGAAISREIFIDPHRGLDDIRGKVIRAVGLPADRFREDALRLLRAMRFSITLGFTIEAAIEECFEDGDLLTRLASVSAERRQAELAKCFHADTMATLNFLEGHRGLRRRLFDGTKMWLEPTTKERPSGHQ
jgi:tRNA nucleotidyltransferase (CCA-adding enzyme)